MNKALGYLPYRTKEAIVASNQVIGDRLIKIQIEDFDDDPEMYSGKLAFFGHYKVKILLTRYTSEVYMYILDESGLTSPLNVGQELELSYVFNVDTSQDNLLVTISDIHRQLSNNDSELFINGIEFVASHSLVSPEFKDALKSIKKPVRYNNLVSNSSANIKQFIGCIVIPTDSNKPFTHRFRLYLDDFIDCEYEISISKIAVSGIVVSTFRKIRQWIGAAGYNLTFEFTRAQQGLMLYVTYNFIPGQSVERLVLTEHYVTSVDDVISNIGGLTVSQLMPMQYFFDETIYEYVGGTVGLNYVKNKNFVSGENMFTFSRAAGKYVSSQETIINSLQNLPTIPVDANTNLSFKHVELVVTVLNDTYKKLTLTLLTETDQFVVFFKLLSSDNNDASWIKDNTGIKASDIVLDNNLTFVTTEEKSTWNAGFTVKPSVDTLIELAATYSSPVNGWMVLVRSLNNIYWFRASSNSWVPIIQTASSTQSGIITSDMYKEIFVGLPISKKVPQKTVYLHRQNSMSETNVGQFYMDYILDLIPRQSLAESIGDFTVNIGFTSNDGSNLDYGAFGGNSVSIGDRNRSNETNSITIGVGNQMNIQYGIAIGSELSLNEAVIALGKFNEDLEDNYFEIGNGASNDARNNLFSIDINGYVSASGYRTTDNDEKKLLMSNATSLDMWKLKPFLDSVDNLVTTITVGGIASGTSIEPNTEIGTILRKMLGLPVNTD